MGKWNANATANATANAQQDEIEKLREQKKQECIIETASVYDLVDIADKEKIKSRSKKYCECLYDKISKGALNRVLEKRILMPELLNLVYK